MKWFLINMIILFSLITITLKAEWEWTDAQMFYTYKNKAGASAVATDKNIVVVGSRTHIYISYDNGTNWTNVMGYWDADREAFDITGIAIKNNWIFFCTDQKNIYRSSDFGVSWDYFQIANPRDSLRQVSDYNDIDFDGKMLYLNSEMFGILKSDDFGSSWKFLCKNLPMTFLGGYKSFLRTDGTIYITTLNFGVFYSTNDGESWNEINNGLNLNKPLNLWLGSSIKSNLILLCVKKSGFPDIKDNKVVYLLNNDSNNWIEIYSGFRPPTSFPYQFPLLSYEDKIILGIACAKDTGIVISGDIGKTWFRKNAGLDYVIENIARKSSHDNIFTAICANDKYIFLGICYDRILYRAPLSDFGISSAEEKSIKLESLSISPNPAGEYIDISRLNKGLQPLVPGDVRIFNVLGECVLTTPSLRDTPSENGNLRVEVSGLVPGIYFVRIADWVGRFVKIE